MNHGLKAFPHDMRVVYGLTADLSESITDVLCRGGCRRDRTDHYTRNIYCRAYYNFFEYAVPRMMRIAEQFAGR